MNAKVRRAATEDIDRLAPLFDAYRQFHDQPADPTLARTFIEQRLRQGDSVLLLATNNEQAVGFVQLYPSFSSIRAARIYVLNDLFVTPEARGHGLGRLLLQEAERFGRAEGAVRLSLSTALTNTSARRLYESLGWRMERTFCDYVLVL